jgi:hypothetical protein
MLLGALFHHFRFALEHLVACSIHSPSFIVGALFRHFCIVLEHLIASLIHSPNKIEQRLGCMNILDAPKMPRAMRSLGRGRCLATTGNLVFTF